MWITNYKSLKVLIKFFRLKIILRLIVIYLDAEMAKVNTKCSYDKTERKNLIVAVISSHQWQRYRARKDICLFLDRFFRMEQKMYIIFLLVYGIQSSFMYCVCMWHIANYFMNDTSEKRAAYQLSTVQINGWKSAEIQLIRNIFMLQKRSRSKVTSAISWSSRQK